MPDRRVMERHMAAISRLLEQPEFAALDEEAANAAITALLAEGELPAAYVLLAESTTDPEEARRLYALGVQAGERALGPEVFAEEAGHFWGLLETRPYMRAREGLAEVLWVLGERPAAIAQLWALLELNPNDNQGVRDLLANWRLTVSDDAGVERLLAQYPDDASAQWAYTKALHHFRRRGASPQTVAALREALAVNPFVVVYLLGAKPVPRQLPAYVGLGDENEAVSYVAAAGEQWGSTPGALEWMATVMQAVMATQRRPPVVRRRRGRRR